MGKMNILIDVSNQLIAEAIKQLLTRNGFEQVVIAGKSRNGFDPAIILVDSTTLNDGIFTSHPEAKILLVDTGLKKEKIIGILLSYKIHGILSTGMEAQLFKKAIEVVHEGQIWIDNSTVKSLFHESTTLNGPANDYGTTTREKEVVDLVVQGYSNKEIANKLFVSENTVKVHLNKIFRKYNTPGRSKLINLVINNGSP